MQVNSTYRSAFFNFIAYMICQISKSHCLDILFSDNCDNTTLDLFLELLDAYPIPKLVEVKVIIVMYSDQLFITWALQDYNNTWDCRVHSIGYVPQFPFFTEVSAQICNMLEESMAKTNKNVNMLLENEISSLTIESCGMKLLLCLIYCCCVLMW